MAYIQKLIFRLFLYLIIYFWSLNFFGDNIHSKNFLFYLWLLILLPCSVSDLQNLLKSQFPVTVNSPFKYSHLSHQHPPRLSVTVLLKEHNNQTHTLFCIFLALSNTNPDDSRCLSYDPSRVQPQWIPKALVKFLLISMGL